MNVVFLVSNFCFAWLEKLLSKLLDQALWLR